jgi:hypothetical protein
LREDESQFVVINILRLHRFQGLLDGGDERLGVGDAFLGERFGRRVIFTCVEIKISRRVLLDGVTAPEVLRGRCPRRPSPFAFFFFCCFSGWLWTAIKSSASHWSSAVEKGVSSAARAS